MTNYLLNNITTNHVDKKNKNDYKIAIYFTYFTYVQLMTKYLQLY